MRGFPPRYNASAGLNLSKPLADVVEGSKLCVAGAEIDIVAWTVPLTDLYRLGASATPWRNVFRSYKGFYEQFKESFKDHFDESRFSAFIRTLAADTLPNSTRRDPLDRQTLFPSHSELCVKSWAEILGPG